MRFSFDDLKKKALGVYHQLSPFDNGQTYKTFVNNAPVQQKQPPQAYNEPQPIRQPSFAQMPTARQPSFAQSNTASQPNTQTFRPFSLPSINTASFSSPKIKTNVPSYGSNPFTQIVNRARDVLDANTPQDYAKRAINVSVPLSPNLTYAQQQEQKGVDGSSIAINPLQRAVVTGRGAYRQAIGNSSNTLGRGIAQGFSPEAKKATAAQLNLIDQNTQLANNMVNLYRNAPDKATQDRALRAYNDLVKTQVETTANLQDRVNKQITDTDPRKMAAATIDAGLTALSFGATGATKAGLKTAVSGAVKTSKAAPMAEALLKTAAGAKYLGGQTALQSGIGAAQGAVNPYILKDPKSVTGKDVRSSAAQNAAINAALPLVGVAGGYAVPKVARQTAKAIDDLNIPSGKQLLQATERFNNRMPASQGGFVANPFHEDGTLRPRVAPKGAPIEKTPDVLGDVRPIRQFAEQFQPKNASEMSALRSFMAATGQLENMGIQVKDYNRVVNNFIKRSGYNGQGTAKTVGKNTIADGRTGTELPTTSRQGVRPVQTPAKTAPKNTPRTSGVAGYDSTIDEIKANIQKNNLSLDEVKSMFDDGLNNQNLTKRDTYTALNSYINDKYGSLDNLYNQAKSGAPIEKTPINPATSVSAQMPRIMPKDKPTTGVAMQPPLKTAVVPVKNKPITQAAPPKPATGVAMQPPDGTLTKISNGVVPPNNNEVISTALNGKKTAYSSKTIPNSQYVSAGVKQRLDAPDYTVNTERQAMKESGKRYQQVGENQFLVNSESVLDKPKGTINRQEAVDAQSAAAILDAKGDDLSLSRAAAIYDKLSEHFTAAGQTIQAAAMLAKRSPESMMYQARKTLQKAGVEMSPQLQSELQTQIKLIKGTTNKAKRDYEINRLIKKVNDNIPPDLADQFLSTWKAGLLSGVKTQSGNFLSNSTFGALHDLSNPLAAGIDRGIGLITKQRTKTLTERGRLSGTGEGFMHAKNYLKTGVDERLAETGKYENIGGRIFKNKIANGYVEGIFRLMGAADRPAYYSQLKNSLYDIAAAQAKNKKLKGADKTAFVQQFVEDPPKAHLQTAIDEANKAVLNFDTIGSKAFNGVTNAINRIPAEGKIGKFAAKLAVGLNAPFVRVPSAFLSRTIDYTALGVPKEVLHQISKGKFDQRALSTAISEATTGTALLATGVALAGANLLTGDYPTDQKEQQRWKAQGIQPNSVKFGNTYISLNYFGPLGIIFGASTKIKEARDKGSDLLGQAGQALGGIPKSLMQQSFLQGVNKAAQAVNDPGRYLSNYVNQMAGSVIPTISNDIAVASDSMQREVNGAKDAIVARIPGIRTSLRTAQDVYGNELKRKTNAISSAINPFRPSDTITNSVKSEIERLHNVDKNNIDLQVTPTPIDKKFKESKTSTVLTDAQVHNLQKAIGQNTQKAWGELIATPEYQALSDIDKANALNRLRQDVTAVTNRQYAASNNLGQFSSTFTGKPDKLTASQTALLTGAKTSGSYATPKSENAMGLPKSYDKLDSGVKSFYDAKSGVSDTKAWDKQPVDDSGQDLIRRVNQMRPEGYGDLPNTNEVAGLYADYKARQADGNWTATQENTEKLKLLRNAYKTSLNDTEKFIFDANDNDVSRMVANGELDKATMDKLIILDDQLVKLRGTAKFSSKLRSTLGYGKAPTSSSSSTYSGYSRKVKNKKASSEKPSEKEKAPPKTVRVEMPKSATISYRTKITSRPKLYTRKIRVSNRRISTKVKSV